MQNSINRTMGSKEWVLLGFLSILWGGAYFFSKVALSTLQPFTVVFMRVSIAALALNAVVRMRGYRLPTSAKMWSAFLVMGLLNNLIPFSLIFWGQTKISSSLASILNATTPLWTVLLAHFLTADEKMTPNRLAGVLLGLLGVVVMIGFEALQGLGVNILAQLAVVVAGLSYAFAGIFGRRFQDTPPIVTSAGQITATTLMMLPVVLLVDKPWQLSMPGIEIWGALLGLALLSTALAYNLYFRLLSSAGATNILLVTLLIPVSAILLGTIILGERLEFMHLVGMFLIGLSLALIDGRPLTYIKMKLVHHEKSI